MCGNDFKYIKYKNGVLPKYCSDSCRQKAIKEAKKRYLQNAKDKKAAKSRLKKMEEEKFTHPLQESKPIVVYENQEELAYSREVLPTADALTMRVLDFALRLGQLKFEGDELVKELNKLKSDQDKQDQQFLHLVESLDKVTIKEMTTIWKAEADNRANRRDAKTLYSIVNQLVYNIPQNPHQYAKGLITKKEKLNEQYATESKAK